MVSEEGGDAVGIDSVALKSQSKHRTSKYKFYKPTTWFHAPKTATYSTYHPELATSTSVRNNDTTSLFGAQADGGSSSGGETTPGGAQPPNKPGKEGSPPSGWMWVWLGSFKRWRRRYVSADTPGVLIIDHDRGTDRNGWTLLLEGCDIMFDTRHLRQFAVKALNGTVYLRVLHAKQRADWVLHVKKSSELFDQMMAISSAAMDTLNGEPVPAPSTSVYTNVQELVKASKDRLQPCWAAMDAGILKAQMAGKGSGHSDPTSTLTRANSSSARLCEDEPYSGNQTLTRSGSTISLLTPHAQDYAAVSSSTDTLGVSPFESTTAQNPRIESASLDAKGDLSRRASIDSHGTDGSPPSRQSPRNCQSIDSPRKLITRDQKSSSAVSMPSHRSASMKLGDTLRFRTGSIGAHTNSRIARRLSVRGGPSGHKKEYSPMTGMENNLADTWLWVQRETLAILQGQAQQIVELEVEAGALEQALQASDSRHHHRQKLASDDHAVRESCDSFDTALSSLPAYSLNMDDFLLSSHGHLDPTSSTSFDLEQDTTLDSETKHALQTVRRIQYLDQSLGRSAAVERMAALEDAAPHDSLMHDRHSFASSASSAEEEEVVSASTARTRLPHPAPLTTGISIWGILKNAIGKDLTKITLPATINEPLSGLQRFAEEMEQAKYLDLASKSDQPLMRALYIAIYSVTPCSSIVLRERKPFNPLLGESFEWMSDDGSHRAVVEQVSHHPPIACMYAEGSAYTLAVELLMTPSFWGKSVSITSKGGLTANLTKWKECFAWNKPGVSMNNIILGRPWLEVVGTVNMSSDAGTSSEITLHKCKGRLQNRGELTGKVLDESGQVAFTLQGSIMKSITATPMTEAAAKQSGWLQGQPREVYTRSPPPADSTAMFHMTAFAMALNDPNDPTAQQAAPTDSRWKPDQRALEEADYSLATSEKFRLEDKQRAAAKARKAEGKDWETVWFDKTPDASTLVKEDGHSTHCFTFNNKYWQARAARDWSACPDIY